MDPVKVGIIGCGNISEAYLRISKSFPILRLMAVADLVPERAKAKAEAHGCRATSVEQMLADPEIEVILNLTIPAAHGTIGIAAIEAGKHVYNEKPFATNRADAQRMLALAEQKGLRVGCAPDTFLGAGLQTCRKVIDDGIIGEPVAATGFMLGHGPEGWHPDPEFFYKQGAGPMFDMGPYYMTALVSLMGPVASVAGSARITFPERTIGSAAKKGQKITVETPTHVTGTLEFKSGAIATVITSFDVWGHTLPNIEVHGTTGSMRVPDPNTFGGTVAVRCAGEKEWTPVPFAHCYAENSRSVGLADMAVGIRTGRPHRASGKLAYHVLDIMQGFLDAAAARKHLELTSDVDRPAAFPVGLEPGELDV